MHELICSKNQLKEWISYEQKKYGGDCPKTKLGSHP